MNEIRATFQIQSEQLMSLEVKMGQVVKILSEEHLTNLPNLEEPSRVEVNVMEVVEFNCERRGANFSETEINERKKVETTLEMILWGKVYGKLENEKTTPISEVDEILFELNENMKAIMVKKVSMFLRELASQKDYMFRQLHGYNFRFLGNDEGKNHHPIRRC